MRLPPPPLVWGEGLILAVCSIKSTPMKSLIPWFNSDHITCEFPSNVNPTDKSQHVRLRYNLLTDGNAPRPEHRQMRNTFQLQNWHPLSLITMHEEVAHLGAAVSRKCQRFDSLVILWCISRQLAPGYMARNSHGSRVSETTCQKTPQHRTFSSLEGKTDMLFRLSYFFPTHPAPLSSSH